MQSANHILDVFDGMIKPLQYSRIAVSVKGATKRKIWLPQAGISTF